MSVACSRGDASVDASWTLTDTAGHVGTEWDGAPNGIPYVVVPGDQPRVSVSFDYEHPLRAQRPMPHHRRTEPQTLGPEDAA